MTIRTKMTLWYSSFLLVLMMIFAVSIMFIVKYYMYNDADNLIMNQTSKINSAIKVNDSITVDDSFNTNLDGVKFALLNKSGVIAFDNTNWKDVKTHKPIYDKILKMHINDEEYLILDTNIVGFNGEVGILRVIYSTEQIENTMHKLMIVFLIASPFYIMIVVAGSLFIASRSLKQIDNVTKTAEQISKKDLSKRIDIGNTKDEVGRLTKTFNEMLERLERAFMSERQFSSDASHELRTPLSVIMANSEEALNEKMAIQEYIEILEQINLQSKKMNKIITQLLILTRGDNNDFVVSKDKFNLKDTVENIISELQSFADSYGVSIKYNEQKDILINADQMLITQMFINLITNSCKYGKIGGYVEILTERKGNNIFISIADNGIGIKEEDIKHIFKRFYRVDKSHSGDSSGLGLPIVKWIVEAHNGMIEVISEFGKGTTIKIKIQSEI